MATLAELERRLEVVEQLLADLRHQQTAVTAPESNLDWYRRTADAFKGIPEDAIEEMHRYGREFRDSHPYPGEGGP